MKYSPIGEIFFCVGSLRKEVRGQAQLQSSSTGTGKLSLFSQGHFSKDEACLYRIYE